MDLSVGIFFTQDWVSMPGVIPVASGGIHVWHMPALTEIFGDDSVLQFGGGTLGHPWGNAPGAVEVRGQGTIPLTRADENSTPREIEQKAAELAYFLRVPIEVF